VSGPPQFLEISNVPGADTAERWRTYMEVLNGVFLRTIFNGKLTFQGLPVNCRRIPESKGKCAAFWHLVQEGYPEEDRTPDIERCRRLLWVAWVIQNASQISLVRCFPQTKRHGDQTWALWLLDYGYVVILAERKGYFLLKTAFLVSDEKKKELERDWTTYASSRKS
jgi:hypothetical protein